MRTATSISCQLKDGSARRLTQTVARETRPTFSADGKTIYFVRDGNAFRSTARLCRRRALGSSPTFAPGPGARRLRTQGSSDSAGVSSSSSASCSTHARSRRGGQRCARRSQSARSRRPPADLHRGDRARRRDRRLAERPRGDRRRWHSRPRTRQAEVPQFVTTSGYVENLRRPHQSRRCQQVEQRVLWISLRTGQGHAASRLRERHHVGLRNLAGWNDDGSRALLFAFSGQITSRGMLVHRNRGDSAHHDGRDAA